MKGYAYEVAEQIDQAREAYTYFVENYPDHYLAADTKKMIPFLGMDCGFGANALFEGSVIKSLCIEIILTFVFVLAILGVTSKVENSSVAGLVIGLSLTLVHLLGIHFTGTSVNPARSFGPALFSGSLPTVWVFIVAPLIGGVLAALVYKVLDCKKAD